MFEPLTETLSFYPLNNPTGGYKNYILQSRRGTGTLTKGHALRSGDAESIPGSLASDSHPSPLSSVILFVVPSTELFSE